MIGPTGFLLNGYHMFLLQLMMLNRRMKFLPAIIMILLIRVAEVVGSQYHRKLQYRLPLTRVLIYVHTATAW